MDEEENDSNYSSYREIDVEACSLLDNVSWVSHDRYKGLRGKGTHTNATLRIESMLRQLGDRVNSQLGN